MKTTFIYALCEPGTSTIRYVGKSNTPERRLRDHLSTSIKMNTYLGHWLKRLVSRGERPSLEVIDEIPECQWEFWEREYIRVFKALGVKLVNTSDGGDGVTMTPEVRDKIGAANTGPLHYLFGKKQSPETCSKKSKAMTGDSNPMFGKKHAPGACAKVSGPLNPAFGSKRSLETRVRMSAAQSGALNPAFGKKRSLGTRDKMRASQAARREREKAI